RLQPLAGARPTGRRHLRPAGRRDVRPAAARRLRPRPPRGQPHPRPHRPALDGTVVSLAPDGRVEQMLYAADQGPDFDYRDKFKTVNVYLFRGDLLRELYVPRLERFVAVEGRTDECFENVLAGAFDVEEWDFRGVDCTDLPW